MVTVKAEINTRRTGWADVTTKPRENGRLNGAKHESEQTLGEMENLYENFYMKNLNVYQFSKQIKLYLFSEQLENS